MAGSQSDLLVENHGSSFLLDAVTDIGRDRIAEDIPEDAQVWGDAIVVEHRFIRDIVVGAVADGLRVQRWTT
jgi:hypothetical protein